MKYLANLFVALLLIGSFSSCSSALLIDAPYEKSKEEIGRYFEEKGRSFEEREQAPILADGEPKRLRLDPIQRWATFDENDKGKRAEWKLRLGFAHNKSDVLFPSTLTLTLRKRSNRSKVSINVTRKGLILSERMKDKEKFWAEEIKGLFR
tara:strand:+ start:163 stop:615 length:453 start_codon:yes stop_codon:yes gene_type:complete